ncbi:DUF5819 family protein [Streptosporangium sp. NPDC002524]|uniref:DUF5819 family protein n=1 Tax=Streptosporangium sp. NPDC002524 TaxID=3154537 RepID=UPI003325093E
MRSRVRKIVVGIAVGLAGTMFAVHAVMTFFFVSPDNYVGISGRSILDSYMKPIFGQNWQLFSPDPIESDMGMVIRAELVDPSGAKRQTEFFDTTSANNIDRVLHTPLPDRNARLASTVLALYNQQVSVMRRELANEDRARDGLPEYKRNELGPLHGTTDFEPTAEEMRRTNPGQRNVISHLKRVLAHVGLEAARQRWGPDVQAVQIRVVRHEFPRFSQRGNPDVGKVQHWTLGWWSAKEVKA